MRRAGRIVTVMVAVGLLGAGLQGVGHADAVARGRLAGADRFATAAAVSKAAFPAGATTAVVARADDFADALGAGALAGSLSAPVLLSGRDAVPAVTMDELARLSASRVVLLGGQAALGSGVHKQLERAGLTVERLAGASRYGTAAEIARRLGAEEIGRVDGRRTAFLASGSSFPDALAAGPLAVAARIPILLTRRHTLSPEARAAIEELGIEQVVVLGGHAAVANSVQAEIAVPTQRIQGDDRTQTAARLARFAVAHLGFSEAEVVLTAGWTFPDALAAAPYAGRRKATVLLTGSASRLGRGARDRLLATAGAVRRLTALGGSAVVPAGVLDEADRAARGITYVFPVTPVSKASYGRDHHDYPATDIFAPCGTAVVSPTLGVVHEVSYKDTWDPAVNDGATRGGLSISIIGDDGVRYYGSHFQQITAGIKPGVRVKAGQSLGTVGKTGSARPTPCHLHFGISPPCGTGDWEVRRGVVAPWPYLDAWKAGDHLSPVRAVQRWASANPRLCP
jgi:peptidoglycan LD-endopeptidase LytH